MAAKPPKPPATLLKQRSPINSDKSANSNDSSASATTTPTTPTATSGHSPVDETFSKLGIRRYNSRDNLLNNISNDNNNSVINGTSAAGTVGSGGGATARPTCNCTNISIMHLFHEMKQEFPTIPDPIVAQCVNENCHQRENCIQMLRNELALHPIPVQTYPAKVLQQHNINQQQQQTLNSPLQQKRSQSLTPSHPQPPQRHKNASSQKPTTLLRPVRAAPTHPPFATLQRLRADAKNSAAAQPINCDSGEVLQNNNSNNNNSCNISNLLKDDFSVQTPVCNKHNRNNNSGGESARETCDMPGTVTAQVDASENVTADFIAALNKVASTPATATRPRPRPNTLDLHTAQQQSQREQLKKQLHQHFQQRSQLQQQQLLATNAPEDTPHKQQKPIRKAPLPPIAPKPVFHNNNSNNHNQYNYNNNNSCGNSPQSQSGGSCSAESNLTSPISSCGESEISANIGLPTQNLALGHINNNRNNNNQNLATSAPPTYQHHQQPLSPLKSPIRHRSVITVQPEPPYTRDFIPPSKINTGALASSTNIGGSGSSTPTSQKSFTSVNLTLRQPTTAVPQSTIDISAGPASSGYGSGLTYSSTSFDARRGYQQNFHITVTDEGGVFNASRIRPRTSGYYSSVEERDSPGGPAGGVRQTTSSATRQQQTPTSAQEAYMLAPNIAQQAIQSKTSITSPTREEMCVPFENSALAETIRRQKTRRDKLATALRENKQKLGHVEEEINMLTETLSPGESERLDYEIERLRSDCQLMLNEIENIRRYGQLSDVERLQLQQQQQQQQQQQHQQPFPRQRPPPQTQQTPQSLYPSELDSPQQQQHTAGSNVGSFSGNSHNNTAVTPNSSHMLPTSNAFQQRQTFVSNHQTQSTDEEDYSDSNTEGGDDDDEPLERWPCSMCTFLNHPQLNICEACECVRILPGTVRIVHNAGDAATATTTTPHPATLMTTNSATAAAAAAALAAAAPTVLGPRGPGGSADDYAGVGAVISNAGSPPGSTTTRPTAAARPVAAE